MSKNEETYDLALRLLPDVAANLQIDDWAALSAYVSCCRSVVTKARRYKRHCERACNGEPYFDLDRQENALAAAVEYVDPRFRVVCQRDPRGATVKIVVPSGRTDDWGHIGICVPGS